MKKVYIVEYDGNSKGGRAVVMADSESEAIALVMDDHFTINFKSAKAVEVDYNSEVLSNDNGWED